MTNYTGKNETWLVFITHGFSHDLNDIWMIPLRESIHLRYGTADRRIIVAIVGWGAVSSRSLHQTPKLITGTKDFLTTFGCPLYPFIKYIFDIFSINYGKASISTMVMGHLLARLAKRVKPDMGGSFKTFCIGYSLGGQLCGFAGKDYRWSTASIDDSSKQTEYSKFKSRNSGSPAMDGILALDPAGPVFESNNELKLAKTDAKAVQGGNSIGFFDCPRWATA